MPRRNQIVLIGSTILACWLGMQGIHEAGHVLGTLVTGGQVKQVVWNLLTISRTDLGRNPHPLFVVWAGPIFGVAFPLLMWSIAAATKLPGSFVLRFFAGFCLIANGAYIACGSLGRVGDCGEMLRQGSQLWQLWLFGAMTIPVGFFLWHRQGTGFGLHSSQGEVNAATAYSTLLVASVLVLLGIAFPGA